MEGLTIEQQAEAYRFLRAQAVHTGQLAGFVQGAGFDAINSEAEFDARMSGYLPKK